MSISETVNQLSTSELLEYLDDNKVRIIDVRSVDAYNGWKLKGEKRGGHIKGARSLPLKWSSYIDWIEIVRSKEILPENKIIVYGYSEDEAISVIKMFVRAGYNDINMYASFIKEWAPDESLPMENLSRYRQLVSPNWVKALINGETPAEFSNDKFVVCHAHYRNSDDYKIDHIPVSYTHLTLP